MHVNSDSILVTPFVKRTKQEFQIKVFEAVIHMSKYRAYISNYRTSSVSQKTQEVLENAKKGNKSRLHLKCIHDTAFVISVKATVCSNTQLEMYSE